MKILLRINLVILIFLAVTSGISKVMLMPQEVEFFGGIGFSNPMLIIFGVCQIIGGLMLVLSKTRLSGAIIVAITFTISAIALFISKNIIVAVITCFTLLMLGIVIKRSINSPKTEQA
ncbi:MAG: hypothetical protein ACI9IA_001697 [Enterobacterales bacterium]|jgi:hypothetical protein